MERGQAIYRGDREAEIHAEVCADGRHGAYCHCWCHYPAPARTDTGNRP